jgi:hypothetical protein
MKHQELINNYSKMQDVRLIYKIQLLSYILVTKKEQNKYKEEGRKEGRREAGWLGDKFNKLL